MGSEIFHTLNKELKAAGHSTNVGDEGGFAPNLKSADEAIGFILKIDREGRLQAGRGHRARARLRRDRVFQERQVRDGRARASRSSPEANAEYPGRSRRRYPIVSIEDGMSEDDFEGWRALTELIGDKCQLVGDDLFVTNLKRLAIGIEKGLANAILIKVNQIGTLTETLDVVEMAHRAGYSAVMSHRSGETEDSTIADLAVATNCGQIKTGSLSRSDRTAKYNQLIRIAEQLDDQGEYAGRRTIAGR